MRFRFIYHLIFALIIFQAPCFSQDSLDVPLFEKKIPQSLQLSHIEIQEQFIDFKKLSDPDYRKSIEFGEVLNKSFDSIAKHYNYPLNLDLPHYLNDLTFHFSAIEWRSPHKIKYSYYLEGQDKEWTEPSDVSKAAFVNLADGEYALLLRALGESKVWSDPFVYEFRIRTPWWRTIWAYLIYGLILLTVLTSVFKIWQQRKREVEEMQQLLAAYKKMNHSTELTQQPSPGSDSFLNLVHATLEAHLSDENFGIAELCELLNISRTQLHRKLKKLTGLSTSHYIRSLRLNIAKRLLESSDLNVSQVAFKVGFSSPAYFSKVFKAQFGQAPKEMR